MNGLRKVELGGGILIAAMSTYVGLAYIRLDAQTSERLGESPVKSIIVLSIVYLVPALAILVGSLLHSVKRIAVGQFLLLAGVFVNVASFLVLLITAPVALYVRPLIFAFSTISAVLGICNSVISSVVQRRR